MQLHFSQNCAYHEDVIILCGQPCLPKPKKKKKKSKKNFICLVETSERNRYMADGNQQLDGRLASRIPTRMKNA